jgi:hemerythrin-like metal-binding protein
MSEVHEPYILGLPEMDAQHSYLYGLFGQLDISANGPLLLKEIDRYLEFHFSSEEHIMRAYGFPGYTVHAADHELAASVFVGYCDNALAGTMTLLTVKKHMHNWLTEHGRSADAQYVKWIQDKRKEI